MTKYFLTYSVESKSNWQGATACGPFQLLFGYGGPFKLFYATGGPYTAVFYALFYFFLQSIEEKTLEIRPLTTGNKS